MYDSNECSGYNDEDLERLSTILTLHDIGFTSEEAGIYTRLLLEQSDSRQRRLQMVEEKRNEILDEMHIQERKLQKLDYLRHELQKNKRKV